MKRILIYATALLSIIACNANGKTTIRGKVTLDGKALAGVLVSDGKEIVETNRFGRYAIASDKAVVEIGKFRSQGFFAWILWLVVHLRSILGVKNKMMVLLNWLWKYVSYNDSIRMITYATKPREVQERIKREQRTHLGEDLMD